jgi:hypothetical protein
MSTYKDSEIKAMDPIESAGKDTVTVEQGMKMKSEDDFGVFKKGEGQVDFRTVS